MKSSGFAWTNVKKVIHLGPASKFGVGCKYGYVNSRGRKIFRSLSVDIDIHISERRMDQRAYLPFVR